MLLCAAATLWIVLFGCFVISCFRAPPGYEDGNGFHYGQDRRRAPAGGGAARRRKKWSVRDSRGSPVH